MCKVCDEDKINPCWVIWFYAIILFVGATLVAIPHFEKVNWFLSFACYFFGALMLLDTLYALFSLLVEVEKG